MFPEAKDVFPQIADVLHQSCWRQGALLCWSPREVGQHMQGLAIGIGCRSASFQVVRFSFVDHHEVSHFDHTSLDALDVVTRATDQHEYEHVDHAPDRHLTLSDPDRFDQDQVVSSGFAKLNGF